MNIGIIGSGKMGASMGKIWAKKGHKVLFSFSTDLANLRAVAETAGPAARSGTTAEAAAFGEVILLSVPWDAVTNVHWLTAGLGPNIAMKLVRG
jgi:predicted dinucleotide-binding enzyme